MSRQVIHNILLRLAILFLLVLLFIHCDSTPVKNEEKDKGLKDYYAGHFLIGAALFPELFDDPISSELGIMVMFTELDVSVLPSPWNTPSADMGIRHENNVNMNPYPENLPDSTSEELAKRYRDIFAIFIKHKDKISRVTFWGLHDGICWKNNFPVLGRTDYPLIFDREMKPKKAYWELIRLVEEKT